MIRIPAQVHLWPWSCATGTETVNISASEIRFPFYGSPVVSIGKEAAIYLPSRHEKFHPLGPDFIPPDSQTSCQIYEAPHGATLTAPNNATMTLQYRAGQAIVREAIRFFPEGALSRFDGIDEKGNSKDSRLAREVLRWSSCFDELLEKATASNGANERLEWQAVRAYLEEIKREAQEPFRALIVDIAERMHWQMPEIVRAARRVLLRERQLLPAGRVEETDSACLRWYIRQPGTDMAEKAGPRQRLLAVARQETHNLHENRILKDFLARCVSEGRRYICNAMGENPAFRQSRRVQRVQAQATLCAQLAIVPHLDDVQKPNPATPPKYVLLHDVRYRKVWYWYQKLLRQDREKDRFWDWQARTWADIVRMLASVAIILHLEQCAGGSGRFRLSPLYQAALRLRGEQLLGCRTAAGSETGPLLLDRLENGAFVKHGVLEIVHPEQAAEHPVTSHLGVTGGHLYLVLRPMSGVQKPQVLILWSVHTAATAKRPSWDAVGMSAVKALGGHQAILDMARSSHPPVLRALVLCSDMDAVKSDIAFEKDSELMLLTIPTAPGRWMDAVKDDIALALDAMLEAMIV